LPPEQSEFNEEPSPAAEEYVPERERRTEFVAFKMTPTERLALERLARQAGAKNLSRFMRTKVLRTPRRVAQH
jgi:hypothetical protein